MPEKPVPQPRADEFARRAAERLEKEDPAVGRVARFDPAWIALFIAIVRLLVILLGPEAVPDAIARLKSPRWWQLVALARRRRLLSEARQHLRGLHGSTPSLARVLHDNPEALAGASVDVALDEAASSSRDDLRAIAEEAKP
jgi:hypothetical protein